MERVKRKHLFLALAALLVAGGMWLARTTRKPTHAPEQSSKGVASETSRSRAGRADDNNGQSEPGHTLRPPNQTRRFIEFTPEQRVEFARKGHGPGG
jgi:hypothetical protein